MLYISLVHERVARVQLSVVSVGNVQAAGRRAGRRQGVNLLVSCYLEFSVKFSDDCEWTRTNRHRQTQRNTEGNFGCGIQTRFVLFCYLLKLSFRYV